MEMPQKVWVWRGHVIDRGIGSGRKSKDFAGLVPMDRARQDWVYENAETARLLAARSLQGLRGQFGNSVPQLPGARTSCNRRWSNGPAGPQIGFGGHKISAFGSPQAIVRSACFISTSLRIAAKAGFRTEADTIVLPRCSAHALLCRLSAFPSDLAVCTGCLEPPDRKVRWQKKFAFPARRMRRGLRF